MPVCEHRLLSLCHRARSHFCGHTHVGPLNQTTRCSHLCHKQNFSVSWSLFSSRTFLLTWCQKEKYKICILTARVYSSNVTFTFSKGQRKATLLSMPSCIKSLTFSCTLNTFLYFVQTCPIHQFVRRHLLYTIIRGRYQDDHHLLKLRMLESRDP